MGKGAPHTVRVDHDNWDWFQEQFTWRSAFSFFVNEVIKELRVIHGERMAPRDAAKKVAESLKRKF